MQAGALDDLVDGVPWTEDRNAYQIKFVAVDRCFDQAHLNRHFTRHMGVSPARYADGHVDVKMFPGWAAC